MNIYKDYLGRIEQAMQAKSGSRIHEGLGTLNGPIQKSFSAGALNLKAKKEEVLLPSLDRFAEQLGLKANFDQKLGAHPDFAHLKGTSETENHYIVSVFIDIKGSTNLFKKYEPETVLVINDTIQQAAIHTCLIFGGYVHRLQGDGLFVYYGGKDLSKKEAVNKALLSTSTFSYFVKNDLKSLFDQQGIENINTRIGIDMGHEDAVVWSNAGIGEISEVTTCSLHTSLASKMQGHAQSNGIVVGDYVKDEAADQDLLTPVCHRTEQEKDRYIFEIADKGFRYTQHDFSWLKFLKRQSFIATDLQGNLSLKQNREAQQRVSDYIKPIAVVNRPYFNF